MTGEIIKERMLRNLKKDLLQRWGDNNGEQVLRELFLQDLNGCCMPEKHLGEDVLLDIQNKSYSFYGAIREEIDIKPLIYIYVFASYDDATTTLMILGDRVLYKDSTKAWNFWFESEETLLDEMYLTYLTLLAKLEKTWDCYTLSEMDILKIAEFSVSVEVQYTYDD